MEAWYSGPDTGGDKVLIRSGNALGSTEASSIHHQLLSSLSITPDSKAYFPLCDPTVAPDSTMWTVCTFRSEVGLTSIPSIHSADTGIGRIYFIGKGTMPLIDITSQSQFLRAVPFTPDINFAWAIFGKLVIGTAGQYQLCISSDDG